MRVLNRPGAGAPSLPAQAVAASAAGARPGKACRPVAQQQQQQRQQSAQAARGAGRRGVRAAAAAPAAPDLEQPKPQAPRPEADGEPSGAGEDAAEARLDAPEQSHDDAEEQAQGNRGPAPTHRPSPRGQGGDGRPQLQRARSGLRRGRVTDFPYKRGDVVVGTVVGCSNGWRVALEHDRNIVGFCSANQLPHLLRDDVEAPKWETREIGLTREFKIQAVPEDLEYNGRGPLLSAKALDLDVIWRRAEQVLDACRRDRECITAQMSKPNAGGLLGSWEGLPLFVPYSYLPRERDGPQDREEVVQGFIGKRVPVSVWDLNRRGNRFVGNMIEAKNNLAYSSLKVGDLLWGEVSHIEDFGVFVRPDGRPSVRALLHIGSISRAHVDTTHELFEVGERVRCVVSGVDLEQRRVNVSTAELEPEAGDMLFSKARVYEAAERQVQDFREFVARRQQEIASGTYEPEERSERARDRELDW